MEAVRDIDADHDPAKLVVDTGKGLVRGDHKRGTYRYKGIPYAKPPVGELRFAPPVPAASWSGERAATGRFPTAPQPLGGVDGLLGGTEGPLQSEADCLTLNVWTTEPGGELRPVMVWIHGGAFVSGTGLTPFYDGANLARRGVVVVTLNYRLGALGFLHLADLAGDAHRDSGNVGLLDQALALAWVRDHIEAFGGDPRQVTIFGESAGGMSVGTHLALSASAGLFGRAIAQSGAASNVHDRDTATDVAVQLLDELGLDASSVEKLRQLPVEAILDAQAKVSARRSITKGLPFMPTVDGTSLPQHPLAAVRDGSAAGIELVTGTNRDELKLFTAIDPRLNELTDESLERRLHGLVRGDATGLLAVYRAALPDAAPRDLFEVIGTDAVFRMPAIDLVEAQGPHGATWLYEFHRPSTAFGGALGAAHAVEIPYAFDNLDAPAASFLTGEVTEPMRDLATGMADAWTSFAREGTPESAGLPAWSAYEPATRTTMVLDLESEVRPDVAAPFRQAWSDHR